MKILASLIKWIKMGNIVLVTSTMLVAITIVGWMAVSGGVSEAEAQETDDTEVTETAHTTGKAPDSAWGLALMAAAISTSVSAIAAGIAVSVVGSAAMGAVAEKPEVMGRSIIFVGLAEGIAIYGLIISIMILGKL
ncbi:ATP synthase subunit C [Candidatus Poribacteria bacterium]